jgi:hypothetical protein
MIRANATKIKTSVSNIRHTACELLPADVRLKHSEPDTGKNRH